MNNEKIETIETGMIIIVSNPNDNYYINRYGEVIETSSDMAYICWFNKNGERGKRVMEWINFKQIEVIAIS